MFALVAGVCATLRLGFGAAPRRGGLKVSEIPTGGERQRGAQQRRCGQKAAAHLLRAVVAGSAESATSTADLTGIVSLIPVCA